MCMEDTYVVLANPLGRSWDFAKNVYDGLVSRNNGKYEFGEIRTKEFADGEFKPQIGTSVRGKRVFYVHDSSLNPSRWFAELSFVCEALKKSSCTESVVVMPYFRFSRQDRKDEPRTSISAAVVAGIIDKYTDGVLTVDIHNPAIDGFFGTRFDNLQSFNSVVAYLKESHPEIISDNLVVMSPDAGGTARAAAFARRIGVSRLVVGYKSRKEAGKVDELKLVGEVKDCDVFLVDDIIDSGGTLSKAAAVAREQGAKKIYGFCTHGLFTKGFAVLDNFDKFFVGDTMHHNETEKLKIVPLAPLFSEAIYRMSHGDSLSALFD